MIKMCNVHRWSPRQRRKWWLKLKMNLDHRQGTKEKRPQQRRSKSKTRKKINKNNKEGDRRKLNR
jgi:hypothetical protein